METLLKADIFFFISSISSIILTALLAVIFFYLIKAARNLYQISEMLQESFSDSEEFVEELKERLEANPIFNFFFPAVVTEKKRRSRVKNDNIKKNNK